MPRNRRPRPRLLDQQVRAPAQHVRPDLPPRGGDQQRVGDQLPEPLAAFAPGRSSCPLSQGVQAGREALRIRHINGTELRKKRRRGFK
jgi:hypothetical protein